MQKLNKKVDKKFDVVSSQQKLFNFKKNKKIGFRGWSLKTVQFLTQNSPSLNSPRVCTERKSEIMKPNWIHFSKFQNAEFFPTLSFDLIT